MNITKNTPILFAVIMVLSIFAAMCISVSADPGYRTVTNPVFYSIIDDQGGAWDTVTWYPKENVDLLSGNWRANLRIGSNQEWIDPNYFPSVSVVTTPSQPGDIGYPLGVRSVSSTLMSTTYSSVTIDMKSEMIPGTTNLGLRGNRYVESEPWVMKQTYTITNSGETSTIDDIAFYQYYFAGPYGRYPVNPTDKISHVDYSEDISDPMGYSFDITQYGEGVGPWAYTALSTDIPPDAHDVGHGGGYPDPPYYIPNPPWRPSALPTDVLRQVENDNMRGWASYDAPAGSDPNAVAGAFKWDIGSLALGESWTITFLQSVAPHDTTIYMPGKITAGGYIPAKDDPKAKANFGLVGQYPDKKGTAQGNVEYQDHAANLNIKSIQIDTVKIYSDKKKGVITGLAQVNGAGSYPFKVYVEDNGEPGKGTDVFKISLPTYPYSNGAVLSSGNIQIHK